MSDLASLWIGDSLGEIEQLSARSLLAVGHSLTIFAYGPLGGVPEGVAVRRADRIFPGDPILRYAKSGSPSLHSNLFRYALLAKTDMTWVDLDIVALRPLDLKTPYYCGHEAPGVVNNAVLRLPQASPTLQIMRGWGPETIGFPPAYGWLRRAISSLATGGRGRPITHWPHGATGPFGLTAILKRTGRLHHALPQAVFYPIPWKDTARLVTAGALDPSDLPDDSVTVHLWGFHLRRALKKTAGGRPEPGSFIDKLAARHPPGPVRHAIPE